MSSTVPAPGMGAPIIFAALTTFLAIVVGVSPELLALFVNVLPPGNVFLFPRTVRLPVAPRGRKRPRLSRPSDAAKAFPRLTRAALFVFLRFFAGVFLFGALRLRCGLLIGGGFLSEKVWPTELQCTTLIRCNNFSGAVTCPLGTSSTPPTTL